MSTGITWTDETWNPTTGCTKVSEGCRNCYAERMARRLAHIEGSGYVSGVDAPDPRHAFDVRLHPDRLDKPLRWRKPKRVFVDSMSDLFHRDVPDEFIDKAFAVMAVAPRHTFQLLTKRPVRMAAYLATEGRAERIRELRHEIAWEGPWPDWQWPLRNVWAGTSIEDQKTADERLPHLERTLAVVRFVSGEPLLGPVDLAPRLPAKAPMLPEEAPATWAEFSWPTWVPARVRAEVEGFWSDKSRRGPREWLQSMYVQHSHPFGAVIEGEDGYQKGAPMTTGRWVHCWNNIGRLVHEDGSVSNSAVYGWQRPPIHWMIVGGESGPDARPMQSRWARDLVRQCRLAGVPTLFKQWGTWLPADQDSEADQHRGQGRAYKAADGSPGLWRRAGVKAAGRLLDGVLYDKYPGMLP